ncbi:MAG: insulinase family protein [Myxococcota bacterium]
MGSWFRIVVWLIVAACAAQTPAPTSSASLVDLDGRRPGDVREQRAFTLDNGMRVLVVSDADLQMSSAALAVEVGSLADPAERQGMAHFLEHMLFLGTEKYPSEGEYGAYMRSNGGYTNAYTASEHTNYLFEVNHDAFEGALDRFAQFFIGPLFTEEFVQRELNAVASEHAKNLQNDFWRSRMVTRALHRDGHPRQLFSTGSLETLEGITRDELIAFYDRHYSANRMTLAVLGTEGLDQLERWAREKFGPVVDRGIEAPTYPSAIFPDALPQRIDIVPVGDRRDLWIEFSVPPDTERWSAKPGSLLGSLVGHEGEGSLLSALKAEGLATSLSAGLQNESYRGIFGVDMELTEAGMADVERVVELVLGYVAMLRDQGLSERYYREQQVVGDLDFYFREHQTGGDGASFLTDQMRNHPGQEIERRLYTLSSYDPDLFAEYVALLRPDNMRVIRIAAGLETDAVEPYYGTKFANGTWPAETVARWTAAEPTGAMHLPPVNPYLPDDVSLLLRNEEQGVHAYVHHLTLLGKRTDEVFND